MYNGKTNIGEDIKYAMFKPIIEHVMELRKIHTLKELSIMLDIPLGSVNNLAGNGLTNVSAERIIKIANALGAEITISCVCKDKTLVTKITK